MTHWLELEEQVGMLWHRLVAAPPSYPQYPQAAVALEEVQTVLGVMFRALGGPVGLEIAAGTAADSYHRLTLRQKLGMDAERMVPTTLSASALRLPDSIALFDDPDLNRDSYLWLAAYCACLVPPETLPPVQEGADRQVPTDALQGDLLALRAARRTIDRVLERFPGLRQRWAVLAATLCAARPRRPLPPVEAALEAAVCRLLGADSPLASGVLARQVWQVVMAPTPDGVTAFSATLRYQPVLPVPLWGQASGAPGPVAPSEDEEEEEHAADSAADSCKRKARRRAFDQAEREDPLILNRFEKLLALAEMVNVNRGKDDEEEEEARKAADDLDEIALAPDRRKTATKIRLDLDLPPDAVTGGSLTGTHTYPEWDYRRGALLPAHCRVLTGPAEEEGEDWVADDAARGLIRKVRRQFEALRPRLMTFRRQPDGDDLDLEAVVRARCDLMATGTGEDRLYQRTRAVARDLSVMVMMDVSLSTDAWVDGRRVLDVEKEALSVFLSGLEACGDENAVCTFTSRKRDWVRVQTVKDFDESFGPTALRRIAALKPGYYTRIGAAIRHGTALLAKRPHRHRLLLVLTDGKPNDVDHYEGRFGIEDSRHAVLSARKAGVSVFGVTIDRKAQEYFPAVFGRGRYAIVGDLSRLSRALPRLYQSVAQ